MNDFLHTLALRSLQPGAGIRPRLPSLFEPPAPGERLPSGGLTVQPPSRQPAGDTSVGLVAERQEMRPLSDGAPPSEKVSSPAQPAIGPREMLGSLRAPVVSPGRMLSGMPSRSNGAERWGGMPPRSMGAQEAPAAVGHRPEPPAPPAGEAVEQGRRRTGPPTIGPLTAVPGIDRLAQSPTGDPSRRERRGELGRSEEQPGPRPAPEAGSANPPRPRVLVPQVQPLVVTTPERTAPSMGPSRREARFAAGLQGMASQEEAPLVQVTIGRIEVRARQAAPPTPSGGQGEHRLPVMSLDEHLRQRNGGGR